MELRPYQQQAREAVWQEWDAGRDRTLLVLPTGCGKTIVFAVITEDAVRRGGRVLILAHRGELLDQASDKLEKVTGLKSAVEKAEQSCLGQWFRVVVGSVQTLMRSKRLAQFPHDYFSTIIIDEAHHAISDSYQVILKHFTGAKLLGVTATPDRGDQKNLGQIFDSLAYEYTLPQAIREGYLVPIRALTLPVKIDFRGVGTAAGDYKPGDIATALDPYLEQIAVQMAEHCHDRKTVVFLPLVATSQKFRDILNAHGFRAAEVNGSSDDREQVLQDFAANKYNVLCNSMLLTEGWDCPDVDCVVVLRSTKVRALYCQMVGRGTRLAEGKDHLLLLDFLWNTEKHELCRPACLIAEDAEVAQKMTERMEQLPGLPLDIEAEERKASDDVVADREAALAEKLEKMRKRKSRLVDPIQYAMSIQAADLTGYEPTFGWEAKPVSAQQKAALEKRGINPDGVDCAGKAEKILRACAQRQLDGLATPKQIRCLERYGFRHVGSWQFDAAKALIDRIACNGWRVPHTISPKEYNPEVVNGV
ncbi:MAG: DEAD/DEAH box helicase [Oscillospiraceae bacterium]|nr:DEAD/DEAH box helicase [Oscillospiraceae bacterium]